MDIYDQIDFYARSLAGEFFEILKDKQVFRLIEIFQNEEVLKMKDDLFVKYKRKFKKYVES